MVQSAMPAMAASTEPIKESVENAALMMDMGSNEAYSQSRQIGNIVGDAADVYWKHATFHSHSETCGGVIYSDFYSALDGGCQKVPGGNWDGTRSYRYGCNGTHQFTEGFNGTTCTGQLVDSDYADST